MNHSGLVVYDKENNKVDENAKVIFMTPDFSNDNILVQSRYGNQDEGTPFEDEIFENKDIKKS